jgi:hypothetical protein
LTFGNIEVQRYVYISPHHLILPGFLTRE